MRLKNVLALPFDMTGSIVGRRSKVAKAGNPGDQRKPKMRRPVGYRTYVRSACPITHPSNGRRPLEPRNGLLQGFARLRALLCRDVRRALAWCEGPPL